MSKDQNQNVPFSLSFNDVVEQEANNNPSESTVYTSGVKITSAVAQRSKPKDGAAQGTAMIKLTLAHEDWGSQVKYVWAMCEGGGADMATGIKRLVKATKANVVVKDFDSGEEVVTSLIGKTIQIKEELRDNKDPNGNTEFDEKVMRITAIGADSD